MPTYDLSKTSLVEEEPKNTPKVYKLSNTTLAEPDETQAEQGNIDLNKRPIVKNQDGSISTVKSIGVNIDGKEVVLPTISDDGKNLSNQEAIELYKKTGKHLGKFNSVDEANKFAEDLHTKQAEMYVGKPQLMTKKTKLTSSDAVWLKQYAENPNDPGAKEYVKALESRGMNVDSALNQFDVLNKVSVGKLPIDRAKSLIQMRKERGLPVNAMIAKDPDGKERVVPLPAINAPEVDLFGKEALQQHLEDWRGKTYAERRTPMESARESFLQGLEETPDTIFTAFSNIVSDQIIKRRYNIDPKEVADARSVTDANLERQWVRFKDMGLPGQLSYIAGRIPGDIATAKILTAITGLGTVPIQIGLTRLGVSELLSSRGAAILAKLPPDTASRFMKAAELAQTAIKSGGQGALDSTLWAEIVHKGDLEKVKDEATWGTLIQMGIGSLLGYHNLSTTEDMIRRGKMTKLANEALQQSEQGLDILSTNNAPHLSDPGEVIRQDVLSAHNDALSKTERTYTAANQNSKIARIEKAQTGLRKDTYVVRDQILKDVENYQKIPGARVVSTVPKTIDDLPLSEKTRGTLMTKFKTLSALKSVAEQDLGKLNEDALYNALTSKDVGMRPAQANAVIREMYTPQYEFLPPTDKSIGKYAVQEFKIKQGVKRLKQIQNRIENLNELKSEHKAHPYYDPDIDPNLYNVDGRSGRVTEDALTKKTMTDLLEEKGYATQEMFTTKDGSFFSPETKVGRMADALKTDIHSFNRFSEDLDLPIGDVPVEAATLANERNLKLNDFNKRHDVDSQFTQIVKNSRNGLKNGTIEVTDKEVLQYLKSKQRSATLQKQKYKAPKMSKVREELAEIKYNKQLFDWMHYTHKDLKSGRVYFDPSSVNKDFAISAPEYKGPMPSVDEVELLKKMRGTLYEAYKLNPEIGFNSNYVPLREMAPPGEIKRWKPKEMGPKSFTQRRFSDKPKPEDEYLYHTDFSSLFKSAIKDSVNEATFKNWDNKVARAISIANVVGNETAAKKLMEYQKRVKGIPDTRLLEKGLVDNLLQEGAEGGRVLAEIYRSQGHKVNIDEVFNTAGAITYAATFGKNVDNMMQQFASAPMLAAVESGEANMLAAKQMAYSRIMPQRLRRSLAQNKGKFVPEDISSEFFGASKIKALTRLKQVMGLPDWVGLKFLKFFDKRSREVSFLAGKMKFDQMYKKKLVPQALEHFFDGEKQRVYEVLQKSGPEAAGDMYGVISANRQNAVFGAAAKGEFFGKSPVGQLVPFVSWPQQMWAVHGHLTGRVLKQMAGKQFGKAAMTAGRMAGIQMAGTIAYNTMFNKIGTSIGAIEKDEEAAKSKKFLDLKISGITPASGLIGYGPGSPITLIQMLTQNPKKSFSWLYDWDLVKRYFLNEKPDEEELQKEKELHKPLGPKDIGSFYEPATEEVPGKVGIKSVFEVPIKKLKKKQKYGPKRKSNEEE